jgi:hypothetical protein
MLKPSLIAIDFLGTSDLGNLFAIVRIDMKVRKPCISFIFRYTFNISKSKPTNSEFINGAQGYGEESDARGSSGGISGQARIGDDKAKEEIRKLYEQIERLRLTRKYESRIDRTHRRRRFISRFYNLYVVKSFGDLVAESVKFGVHSCKAFLHFTA